MKYDKEIKQEVIKRYKMGESALSIAKDDYTPCSSTIHRWVNLVGVDRQIKKPIKFTNELKEEIIHLFEKGYNTIAIGKRIGCHPSTVGKFLRKKGIETRKNKINVTVQERKEICRLYKEEL